MAKRRRPKTPPETPPAAAPQPAVADAPTSMAPVAVSSVPAPSDRAELAHPDVRHEPSVLRFRWALWTFVVALAIGAAQLAGVSAFFYERQEHSAKINASEFPLAGQRTSTLPVQPRLEQLDRVAQFSSDLPASEQPPVESTKTSADLNRLGPAPEAGFVQIPIDRAMELVIGQLKSREQPSGEAAKDRGLVDGGESNSGRMLRGPSP